MSSRGRILVLWNQTEEDIYEHWRDEGPQPLSWDPNRTVPDVGTVAEEMQTFVDGLRQGGFHVDLVNVEDDLERVIGAIRLYRPDAVFNLVEYFNEDQVQEAYIAGLYEMLGVQYTGCRPVALANCQNKYRTKIILEAAELPTAEFFLARKEPVPVAEDYELEFPLIVKPALEDASGGIEHASVVQDQAALEARCRHVFKEFEMPALVEEYIEGREIHAAILGNDPPEVLPLFEMEFDDSEFNPEGEWRPQIISFRAKWDPHSKEFYTMDAVCPAEDLEPEVEDHLRDIAVRAFKAMGCRDYARVDMRVDEDGQGYILEVNPNPDLVDGAAYAMCATASGRTYSETVCEVAEMPLARRLRALRKQAQLEKAGLPTDQLLREWKVKQRQPSEEGKSGEGAGGAEDGAADSSAEPAADEEAEDSTAEPAADEEAEDSTAESPEEDDAEAEAEEQAADEEAEDSASDPR